MKKTSVPFSKPYISGNEESYIHAALQNGKLSGDGEFTKKSEYELEKLLACRRALITHSCTAALEMAAMLIDIKPGDEFIVPSYTFVSTAMSFILRGAKPVFVDIRPDTLNIDVKKIESAITAKTKAIVPVHYAGISCDMDMIMEIANKYNLFVIEDAAQGVMSKYKGRPLGTIGDIGAISFHDTKNIICGEGGALIINDESLIRRAEIIREKGTNRANFVRGLVDKYTWVDVGSSYIPSELNAAFLLAQLEKSEEITNLRMRIWQKYHQEFEELERGGKLIRPSIPSDCTHNAHMYYLILKSESDRGAFIEYLRKFDIFSASHYVPLHNSPYGSRFMSDGASLSITEDLARRLVRLPLWSGMTGEEDQVIAKSKEWLQKSK